MQQLSVISSLQNFLHYFCTNEPQQKEQFPPSKNSYPPTEPFPMHAVVTEDHKVVFLDVCITHHYQFSLLSKNPFSCKRFQSEGEGGEGEE